MHFHNLYSLFKILVNRSLLFSPAWINIKGLLLNRQNSILIRFLSGGKHFVILSLLLFLVLFSHSYALHNNKNSSTDEQLKVKAAFILNLARFVEWPGSTKNDAENEIVVCFYQYNFLKESVATILDKKIDNRPIQIKIVHELMVNEPCKVLLIPADTLPLFIEYNDSKNLYQKITITDLSGDDIDERADELWNNGNKTSLENKIIFRLKREKLRLRFEVNKIASEKLGINIGSELLKLGILVEDQGIDAQREKP